jgi:hypothetical protein
MQVRLGMRDGKLYDQYLGRFGGTPGKHAAVWHSQLWHGIGHQWGTALLVLGPWPVAPHCALAALVQQQPDSPNESEYY